MRDFSVIAFISICCVFLYSCTYPSCRAPSDEELAYFSSYLSKKHWKEENINICTKKNYFGSGIHSSYFENIAYHHSASEISNKALYWIEISRKRRCLSFGIVEIMKIDNFNFKNIDFELLSEDESEAESCSRMTGFNFKVPDG